MHVYERVRDYISQQGYAPSTVANKAGIPETTFHDIINGKRVMYADDLRTICIALNVSPEQFISLNTKNE